MPSAVEPTIPSSQRAIIQGEGGRLQISKDVPVIAPGPQQALIRIVSAALNPTDYKMPTNFPSPGARVGCDFAGEVVALGSEASSVKIGDRVCGAIHGSNPIDHTTGAFGQYVTTDANMLLRVPDYMDWASAAALGGSGHGTLVLVLWKSLGLTGRPDQPADQTEYVLVYGGSTATGTMAIQILSLSGYLPITTCSPSNFEFVKSLGAVHAFDYNDPAVGQKLRELTGNNLEYAIDCISTRASIPICYEAIGRGGGYYTSLELLPPDTLTRKAIEYDFVMGYELWGKEIALSNGYERAANPESRKMGEAWFPVMQDLIDRRKIKNHPPRILEGGLNSVADGLEMMKRGEIRGQKLVVMTQ